jgi:hypothetical protein
MGNGITASLRVLALIRGKERIACGMVSRVCTISGVKV